MEGEFKKLKTGVEHLFEVLPEVRFFFYGVVSQLFQNKNSRDVQQDELLQ